MFLDGFISYIETTASLPFKPIAVVVLNMVEEAFNVGFYTISIFLILEVKMQTVDCIFSTTIRVPTRSTPSGRISSIPVATGIVLIARTMKTGNGLKICSINGCQPDITW
jgi:hypothetical protein